MTRLSFDLIFILCKEKKTCERTARINTTKINRRDWEAKLDIRIINKKKKYRIKLKPWIENDEYFLLIKSFNSIFRSP